MNLIKNNNIFIMFYIFFSGNILSMTKEDIFCSFLNETAYPIYIINKEISLDAQLNPGSLIEKKVSPLKGNWLVGYADSRSKYLGYSVTGNNLDNILSQVIKTIEKQREEQVEKMKNFTSDAIIHIKPGKSYTSQYTLDFAVQYNYKIKDDDISGLQKEKRASGSYDPIKKEYNFNDAQEFLNNIYKDLRGVLSIIEDALNKNKFDENKLNGLLKNLNQNAQEISFLENLKPDQKNQLKKTSQAILELLKLILIPEAQVLDLWTNGYKAYERDLDDNFRNLPNSFLKRPNNKNLYEELSFAKGEGQKSSFDKVRSKYQERFNSLKKLDEKNFGQYYFDPYLRVLDYIFRTKYNKLEYDSYLEGESKFNEKVTALSKHKLAIHKLFSDILILISTLELNMLSLKDFLNY